MVTVSRTETLSKIAGHIEEIVAVAKLMPDSSLVADLYRIADLLRDLLLFISELPDAFDETSPWWSKWSAAQALLRSGPTEPSESKT
ncbi:hypothetical protein [Sphingomonas trueperi]|uniref:hypothetical protein n=1 Tax=Sphingomonas trueperi TaxID=53317 RepID=UPI000EAB9ABE